MELHRIIACVFAALSAGTLGYMIVKSLLSTGEESAEAGAGIHALLALPAALIARRRALDIELSRKLDSLEALRVQAGGRFLEGASAAEIFAARFVFPLLALVFFLTVGALLRLPPGLVLVLALFFAVMLYAWPETALRSMAEQRSLRFVHDLPMALDVMRLVTQSGGDLQSAIRSVVEVIGPSPVREELVRAMNEVSIGTSLPQALNHIGERVATQEANAVFTTLSQSLEMGTSVSENLGGASELIRHGQRIKAQTKAQKAVVAMTFPLLLLILPGIFIVLFAPLVIQFMNR